MIEHDTISKIPNKEVRNKLDNAVSNGNDKFQGIVDRGKGIADGVNRTIGVGREMVDTVKKGWNQQVRPTVLPPTINHQVTKYLLPNAQ